MLILEGNNKTSKLQATLARLLIILLVLTLYPHFDKPSAIERIPIAVKVDNFNDTNTGGDVSDKLLWMKGSAAVDNNKLILTDNSFQAGSVVKRNQVQLKDGFSSYFKMYFSGDADGIAFILYKSETPKLGDNGGALGYGDKDFTLSTSDGVDKSIHDSIIVEFDSWRNFGDESYDPSDKGHHVAIMLDGNQVHSTQSDGGHAFTEYPLAGKTIHAWVDYQSGNGSTSNGTVSVTFGEYSDRSSPSNSAITRTIGVSDNAPIAGDNIFVGFTSSTGGNSTTHELLTWYFSDTYLSEGIDPDIHIQAPASISIELDRSSNPRSAEIRLKDAAGEDLENQIFDWYLDDIKQNVEEVSTGAVKYYIALLPNDLTSGSHNLRVVGLGGVTNFVNFTTDYDTELQLSADSSDYRYGDVLVLDTDISIESSESIITGASVTILNNKPGDQLSYGGITSGINPVYDAGKGTLVFSESKSPSDWESILGDVTFHTTSTNMETRKITFSLGTAVPGDNGHFYEYVREESNTGWSDALSRAAIRTYFGLEGYLATITSEAENNLIFQKLNSDAWIGASDDYRYIEDPSGTAIYAHQGESESRWHWVSGPESGTLFSIGNGIPITQPSSYANWNGGEPNNSGGEHYGEIYSSGSGVGKWNDLPDYYTSSSLGYVVEYGGMAGDPLVLLQDSISLTISKANQTISFDGGAWQTKAYGSEPFPLAASASSGLSVTYISSNEEVATVDSSGLVTISGTGSAIISVSQAGNDYYNAASAITRTLTVNDVVAPSSGSRPGDGAPVIVNGTTYTAGTASRSTEDGKSVTTVTVQTDKLERVLDSQGDNPSVIIPISGTPQIAAGVLTGQMVKDMEDREATLSLQTGSVTYTMPASEINIDAVSGQLGANLSLSDITLQILIAEPAPGTVKIVEGAAAADGFQIMVPAVDFHITATYKDKTVPVETFNSYVQRTVLIPEGVDPEKITTAIVVKPDGTSYHVPTQIIEKDGRQYAVINSLTNSTYTVIWNPVTFADASSHWAKDAINEMGSRKVVTGVTSQLYEPNRNITRAEFAAMVVRGLGLDQGLGTADYKDVSSKAWYRGVIETAFGYGIIQGYGDKTFQPNQSITREQAMTMLARAMKITKLEADLTTSQAHDLLQNFSDKGLASSYAKESIAQCLQTGIVQGRTADQLAPEKPITRAEVAVMIQRLLEKSDLI